MPPAMTRKTSAPMPMSIRSRPNPDLRGDAVMVLSVDDPIPSDLLATIHGINGIQEAHPVTL